MATRINVKHDGISHLEHEEFWARGSHTGSLKMVGGEFFGRRYDSMGRDRQAHFNEMNQNPEIILAHDLATIALATEFRQVRGGDALRKGMLDTTNLSMASLVVPGSAEKILEVMGDGSLKLEIGEPTRTFTPAEHRSIEKNVRHLAAHGVEYMLDDIVDGADHDPRLQSMYATSAGIKTDKELTGRIVHGGLWNTSHVNRATRDLIVRAVQDEKIIVAEGVQSGHIDRLAMLFNGYSHTLLLQGHELSAQREDYPTGVISRAKAPLLLGLNVAA